jgi:hypothetical protein
MLTAEWESCILNELDISSTELSEICLLNILARMPKLSYLAVPNCDGFTDQVNTCSLVFFLLQSQFFFYSRFLIN